MLIGPRGGVANKGGLLESEAIITSIHQQLTIVARTAQMLIDIGVVTVSQADS